MATSQQSPTDVERRRIVRRLTRMGYLETGRVLQVLQRFQSLIRHRAPYLPDAQMALPIEELLAGVNPEMRELVLRQKINRLIPSVSTALMMADVSTAFTRRVLQEDGTFSREPFDLIESYFDPAGDRFEIEQAIFLTQVLERAIGFYVRKRDHEKRELWKPTTWIAILLRQPIILLEKTGLESDEASSVAVKIYDWLVRIAILTLIAFGATRLGISIPWEKIISAFTKRS